MTYTLVATAKNEGPYLLEWVAYHRMIGFDNILIFQNDSDDLTGKILKVMDQAGLVEYRYNDAVKGRHQVRAYKRAARQDAFKQADWAIALDLDEFLHIDVGGGHLDDLMDALPETDVVLLNWRRFGNGGHIDMADALVTEHFLHAEYSARVAERLTPYKALFRPGLFERCGVHQPSGPKRAPDDMRTCNGSGLSSDQFERLRFRCTDPNERKLAQINHYITRDAASFVLKSNKGSAHQADRGIDKKYWARRNFNDETDDRLAARNAQIIEMMSRMDDQTNGRLSRLRGKSLRLHKERFDDLVKQPVYRELYEFCSGTQVTA